MRYREFKWIPIDQLRVSEQNIRKTSVEQEKSIMKETIIKKGIMEPLTVYYNEDEQVYEIVKGQRRYLAALDLKKEGYPIFELPCIVKEAEDPEDPTEESLLDEFTRLPVEHVDIGQAILRLLKKYGDADAVAKALGIPVENIHWFIAKLNLNPPAKVEELEEKEEKEEKKAEIQITLADVVNKGKPEEKKIIQSLTLEERKELERRLKEKPEAPLETLVKEVKEWRQVTRDFTFAMELPIMSALSEWAREKHEKKEVTIKVTIPEVVGNISLRRAADILINELLRAYLKEEKYLA